VTALVGDPHRVRQTIMNLVGNAIKFTSSGSVRVTAVVCQTTNEESSPCCEVTVKDTGIGVSQPDLARLFQAFEQADSSTTRRFGGSGLGLVISRQLVEGMGGSIGAESTLGQGSRFWFRLPFVPAPQPSVKPTAPAERRLLNGKVLIAEDNNVNRRVAVALLARFGCQTVTAGTGREAIELWRLGSFDAVLMDCLMPEMDGFEATQSIRQLERALGSGKRTPIIAVTANAFLEDKERCRKAGMDDFVSKPVDPGQLWDALARWLV
jgi:CheY-like chemotaxis protein